MKIVPSCSRCNNPIDQAADPAEGEASYCRKCSELLDDDDDDVGIGNGDSDKSEQTGAGSGAEGSTAPAQKNATTAALEDQQEDQPPAKIIDPELPDNYEILEVFEQCQHGRAYKIRDKNLEKVLIARFVTAGVARLTGGLSIETAAQLLTQINHPHLLTVYDWRTDLKTNCLIMDNAPETSVETIIAKEGFFDLPRAFDVFIQACEGLEELHKQRLVHGFVRPRTIRLAVTSDSKLDAVKVMSFSVTNVFSNNIDQPLKIGRNYTCNDAFYMSPEELNGALPTVSGDIYSLGCVIFHAITGK